MSIALNPPRLFSKLRRSGMLVGWFLSRGDIRRFLQQPRVTAADHFRDGGKIVLAFDRLDSEAAIVGAIGPAIAKADERSDDEGAADVGDVDAFDPLRGRGQAEDFAEFGEVAFGFDGDRQAVRDALETVGFFGGTVQVGEEIAQLGGLFVFLGRGRFFHFVLELGLHFLALTFEEVASGFDLVEVLIARYVPDARRCAVFKVGVKAMFVIALGGSERTATAEMVLTANE